MADETRQQRLDRVAAATTAAAVAPMTAAPNDGIPDTAGELMGKPPIFCAPTDTLNVAARLLWERDIGAVIVTDPVTSEVVGMITDRDIAMCAYHGAGNLFALQVWQAMSKEVYALGADAPITEVLALMAEKQCTQIPVYEVGKKLPAGLLSIWSIAASPDGQTRLVHHINDTIVAIFKGRGI